MKFKVLSHPRLWLTGFLLWVATLYALSSFSSPVPPGGPEIPHLDKIAHFGYFMGGAFIFTSWLLLRKNAPSRILLPLLLFTLIGALDEWHQTFTPGRSGNDPFDWLADILGSLTGILIAHRLHPLLQKLFSPACRTPMNPTATHHEVRMDEIDIQ